MKSSRRFLGALVALCFTAVAAFAADASPAGTWKWTQQGRQGGQATERSLVLELKDGKLTGTLKGFTAGQFEVPDMAIEEASFKDGTVSFSVTREFNGNKFTTKYTGKLAGDKITGSSESPGREGGMQKRDWNPTRAK
ncbi:MAG: hypothetical protein HZA93_24240 [Verrucomicrobia bacterium]|nr:hypothetical protein [Verrucomicrobiota bacterium]